MFFNLRMNISKSYLYIKYFETTKEFIERATINCTNSKWIDDNYDKLENIINLDEFMNGFYYFIMEKSLFNPSVEMLQMLQNHNFNFFLNKYYIGDKIYYLPFDINRLNNFNFNAFKWLIDNSIIENNNPNYYNLCNILLQSNNKKSFKYALKNGFKFNISGYLISNELSNLIYEEFSK